MLGLSNMALIAFALFFPNANKTISLDFMMVDKPIVTA